MRRSTFFVFFTLIFIVSACKKENSAVFKSNANFSDSALAFLKTNLTSLEFQNLDIVSGVPLVYLHQNIGFRIKINGITNHFIFLKAQDGTFTGNRVDLSDKESLIANNHNGDIYIESLDNKTTTQYIIKGNKLVKRIVSVKADSKNTDVSFSSAAQKTAQYELQEVVVISIVHNGSSADYWNLSVLFNSVGANWIYTALNDGGIDGGGGGGITSGQIPIDNVTALPAFSAPKRPIVNIRDELKCFTAVASSSYSVSVNVNQPRPNSRDKINFQSDFMVGHSFLTLQQVNADGSQITRTVGFYPKTSAKPGSSKDESIFGDDTYTPYAVSLKISVSGNELNTVINALVNQQAKNFDLSNFNCTNSAIEALGSIHINLPSSTSGDPFFFDGNSPAELGEDIRSLNLDNFNGNNGNRNMERKTSDSDSMQPASKSGSC